ncbi:MAG: restriction endonuclease [Campylobacteraceae bacterium]|nr:restriction endonuclease [Campylobacteraceae bacterium]
MLSAIDASTRYFCQDILGLQLRQEQKHPKEFFGASIPLTKNSTEHHFYLFFEPAVLDIFGEILLGESPLCEAFRDDLCKEVANQIVGHAKVSLETEDGISKKIKNSYKLGTPEFLGQIPSPPPISLEGFLLYRLDKGVFLIGKGQNNG